MQESDTAAETLSKMRLGATQHTKNEICDYIVLFYNIK